MAKNDNITYQDIMKSGEYQLDQQKYKQETTYEKHLTDASQTFKTNTIKLTDELASQCKKAVEARIKVTQTYTEERFARIQDAYKQYFGDVNFASSGNTISNLFVPETFNAVEDWSDDLYRIFKDMLQDIELSDAGYDLETLMGKSLPTTPTDQQSIPAKGLIGVFQQLKDKFGIQQPNENYFFSKREAIKKFLINSWIKSGADKQIFKFLFMGLISGEFCCKDTYGPTMDANLTFSDEGGFDVEYDQEQAYRFVPVDTRNLIYPKGNRDWTIEKIHTTFSKIVGQCVDEEGKPLDYAPYDVSMLKKVASYLKSKALNTLKEEQPSTKMDTTNDTSADISYDDVNIWDVDGEITLYECHHIPIVLPSSRKKPYLCLITCFNFGTNNVQGDNTVNILPIGVRKTPYVAGNPYNTMPVFEGDGELAGRGIPEVIKPIQRALNDTLNLTLDQLNLGLYGVMVVDDDVMKDKSAMKQLTPREIMRLKNLKGRKVSDAVDWMQPPSTNISAGQAMSAFLTQMADKTSRKGFPSQGLGRKVSASEVQNISNASQRAITKVSLRVNQLLLNVLYKMYIYNILNATDYFQMKMDGYKILPKHSPELTDTSINQNQGDFEKVPKVTTFAPQELFVKGVQFKLTAVDSIDKKAVERQQFMQMFNLLKGSGMIVDQTGQPHIMEDDSGSKVMISEYRAIKKLADVMDYGDIFEQVPEQKAQDQQKKMELMKQMQAMASQKTGTPQLKGSPEQGDVSKQATTLSSGMNV